MSDALRHLPLACPIDGRALSLSDGTLVCDRGHGYDVSRHGYVNLLPVQFKPSKDPGDSAVMVAARRRVLDDGLFEPLAEAVVERVLDCIGVTAAGDGIADESPRAANAPGRASTEVPLVVDAGCGDGFYTARMAARLRASGAKPVRAPEGGRAEPSGDGRDLSTPEVTCGEPRDVHVLGTDISVHAVKAATRRHRDIAWAVANNTRLPVLGGAPDVIVSLFGFETWEPWAALQRCGQHVVVAHAGPRHLIELREAIYTDVRVHDAPAGAAAVGAGYVVVDERSVGFRTPGVSLERLADVLAMTPHGYRAPSGASSSLAALARRASPSGPMLTVDVILRSYRRT